MRYELNSEEMSKVNGGVIVKMMPRHKTYGKTVYYIARNDKGFEIKCSDLEAAQAAAIRYNMGSEVITERY